MRWLRHPLRVGFRLAAFFVVAAGALTEHFLVIWPREKGFDYPRRARWSQRWGRRFLKALCVEVTVVGEPPTDGLLVANHLGYVDIPVLAAASPIVFVSKAEERNWPVIGWLTRCAGTIYVDRSRKADVVSVNEGLEAVARQQALLCIFPEGTSTGGDRVLPFRPALLEPAVARGWCVSTAWIGYRVPGGSAADEVCYWRDMVFGPHFLHLLSLEKIVAVVAFGPTVPSGEDRKQLALQLHAEVSRLAERHGPGNVETEMEPYAKGAKGATGKQAKG